MALTQQQKDAEAKRLGENFPTIFNIPEEERNKILSLGLGQILPLLNSAIIRAASTGSVIAPPLPTQTGSVGGGLASRATDIAVGSALGSSVGGTVSGIVGGLTDSRDERAATIVRQFKGGITDRATAEKRLAAINIKGEDSGFLLAEADKELSDKAAKDAADAQAAAEAPFKGTAAELASEKSLIAQSALKAELQKTPTENVSAGTKQNVQTFTEIGNKTTETRTPEEILRQRRLRQGKKV